MAKRPPTPAGLGEIGTTLWKEIAWKYELRPDEMKILRDACKAADFQALLEDDIVGSELKTTGSMEQEVINPSVSEWRQYSNVVTAHLLKLKLPDEATGIQGVVKTSKVSEAAKQKSRVANRARWGTPAAITGTG